LTVEQGGVAQPGPPHAPVTGSRLVQPHTTGAGVGVGAGAGLFISARAPGRAAGACTTGFALFFIGLTPARGASAAPLTEANDSSVRTTRGFIMSEVYSAPGSPASHEKIPLDARAAICIIIHPYE
jgi:hypothetical protein